MINYGLFQKFKLIRNCEFNNLIIILSLKYPISTITPTSWFPMLLLLYLIIMQTCLQFWADFCQSAISLIDNNLALPALLNGLQIQLHLYRLQTWTSFITTSSLSQATDLLLSRALKVTTMSTTTSSSLQVSLQFSLFILTSLVAVSAGNFYQDFDITWGDDRAKILNGGNLLTLSLDKISGSGFQSKNEYLFGRIDMQIMLVAGNSAGTVTAYYVSLASSLTSLSSKFVEWFQIALFQSTFHFLSTTTFSSNPNQKVEK